MAAIGDFLFLWQLPLILAMLLGSVIVATVVLRWSLRQQGASRRLAYSRCVVAVLLSAIGAGFCGGVVFIFARAVGQLADVSLIVPGGIAGLLAAAVMSYLILHANFQLSKKQSLVAWGRTLGAVGALLLIIGAPTAKITYDQRHRKLQRDFCQRNLMRIQEAIVTRHGLREGPKDLPTMLEKNMVAEDTLTCPGNTSRPIGYFYRASPGLPRDRLTSEIRACDLRGNHPDGRTVLYTNGRIQWCPEEEFQALLERPENQAFAEALRRVEGN